MRQGHGHDRGDGHRGGKYGVTDQADFINGCMEIKTLFTPEELLDGLHEIEAAAGRKRIIHWAPGRWTRTLFSITIWCMYRNSLAYLTHRCTSVILS